LTFEEQPTSLEASESPKDTALVLERFVDAIGMRIGGPVPDKTGVPKPGRGDMILRKFADYMKIPVINLSSDLYHPTQALADIMILKETKGDVMGDVSGRKLVVMWAYSPLLWDWTPVHADPLVAATYGMDITMVYPEGYDLDPSVMSTVQQTCSKSGRKLEISHNLKNGLEGADAVFARNWWSPNYYMNTKEEERRLAAQHKDWRLTEPLLRVTNNACFINPMPFHRGTEVDSSVADGSNSVVYDQAENLLHVRKAILASLMADSSVLESI